MCKNYGDLDFRHFVIDQAGNIFGSARVSSTGMIANFLISSEVKQQSGDSWQCVDSGSAEPESTHCQLSPDCCLTSLLIRKLAIMPVLLTLAEPKMFPA